jgi:hypothetical protein
MEISDMAESIKVFAEHYLDVAEETALQSLADDKDVEQTKERYKASLWFYNMVTSYAKDCRANRSNYEALLKEYSKR